jgi:RNA-directed DNA polymerase
MRRFVLGWKVLGHERRFRARIVNYADDIMICCRGQANQALDAMRNLMQKLKLTVNEEKTQICHSPQESVTFLGYTIGRCYSYQTGRPFLGTRPSQARITRLCREVSRLTGREWTWRAEEEQVGELNRMLVGWATYFSLGRIRPAYRNVNLHVVKRLRQWLCHKHKVRGQRGTVRFSDKYLHDSLGLVRLTTLIRTRPWANA